jgi:hypothetical protein
VVRDLLRPVVGDVRDPHAAVRGGLDVDVVDADAVADDEPKRRQAVDHRRGDRRILVDQHGGPRALPHDVLLGPAGGEPEVDVRRREHGSLLGDVAVVTVRDDDASSDRRRGHQLITMPPSTLYVCAVM